VSWPVTALSVFGVPGLPKWATVRIGFVPGHVDAQVAVCRGDGEKMRHVDFSTARFCEASIIHAVKSLGRWDVPRGWALPDLVVPEYDRQRFLEELE